MTITRHLRQEEIAERLYVQLLADTEGNRAEIFTVLDLLLTRILVHHVEPDQWRGVVQMIVDHVGALVPAYARQIDKETRQ
jgi:hypothetical protein